MGDSKSKVHTSDPMVVDEDSSWVVMSTICETDSTHGYCRPIGYVPTDCICRNVDSRTTD